MSKTRSVCSYPILDSNVNSNKHRVSPLGDAPAADRLGWAIYCGLVYRHKYQISRLSTSTRGGAEEVCCHCVSCHRLQLQQGSRSRTPSSPSCGVCKLGSSVLCRVYDWLVASWPAIAGSRFAAAPDSIPLTLTGIIRFIFCVAAGNYVELNRHQPPNNHHPTSSTMASIARCLRVARPSAFSAVIQSPVSRPIGLRSFSVTATSELADSQTEP